MPTIDLCVVCLHDSDGLVPSFLQYGECGESNTMVVSCVVQPATNSTVQCACIAVTPPSPSPLARYLMLHGIFVDRV